MEWRVFMLLLLDLGSQPEPPSNQVQLPIRYKPIKTSKLIVKSRKRRFIQCIYIEKTGKEIV